MRGRDTEGGARARRALRELGALALLGALQAACGGAAAPEDARLLVDLAGELEVAEVHREAPAIDVGTPAGRRPLHGGWSWDEADDAAPGSDRSFAWGTGEASELEFFLTEPRPLELRLRGRPFRFDGASPQTVRVEVGGERIERLVLEPEMGTYTVALPEDALRPGINRLTLRYGWARSPESVGLSDDPRELAVAWAGFRFDPVPPGTGEVAAGRGPDGEPLLELPFGAGVDYFVELPSPAGARTLLEIEALRASGSGGSLTVEIQEAGTEPVRAAKIGPVGAAGRRRLLELPVRPGGPERQVVRLGLRAVPEEPEGAGAGDALLLSSPRLLTTAPAPEGGAQDGGSERAAPAAATPDGGRPHVLVYLVDTLRADRVGVYASSSERRDLTPRIDAFAAGATVFGDPVAEAPWTRPTVASLLTGLPPRAHGVTTLDDRLADEAVTLPELFGDAGYRTAAFSTNWHVTEATGMAQGFDDFILMPEAVHADTVNRRVLRWLDRVRAEGTEGRPPAPLFVYVHALDPHAPYEPPERFRRRLAPDAPPAAGARPYLERIYEAAPGSPERAALMAPIPDLYDAEVAAVDAAFGALLDALGQRGLEEDTALVFVSDHGEGLDEHAHLGHGHDLYGEALRVPMIVRLPGGAAGSERIGGTTQPSELFDLLVDLLDGGGVRAATSGPPRPAFSHLDYEGRRGISVVLGDWKVIEPLSPAFGRRPELYHRGRDPGERTDVAARHPVRLGHLRTLIRRHLRATDDASLAESAELDPATRRGLEALGYL